MPPLAPKKKSGKPRGRPRHKGKGVDESTRQEILRVAALLFSAKGYAGTTMAEIANLVGIRGPSLYYYFDAKSEIMNELANVGLDITISTSTEILLDTQFSPAARLYRLTQELVIGLRTSDYDLSCIFDPALRGKEFNEVNERLNSWLKDLAVVIVEGVESDQLVVEDVELMVGSFYSMLASSIRELGHLKDTSHRKVAAHLSGLALSAMMGNELKLKAILQELENSDGQQKYD